jgi:hypothetical protein
LRSTFLHKIESASFCEGEQRLKSSAESKQGFAIFKIVRVREKESLEAKYLAVTVLSHPNKQYVKEK